MTESRIPEISAGSPTVLLRHILPDGSWHVDWMIAREPEGSGPLVCFRVGQRVDEIVAGQSAPAERIADHRPAYLQYEGEVSGERGCVTRLTRGVILACEASREAVDRAWKMSIRWTGSGERDLDQQLLLEPRDLPTWSVKCVSNSR